MNPELQYEVGIPGGLWKQGSCLRRALLRPLNGWDEAFLLEAGESLSAAARTTALLSRCLVRLGTDQKVTPGEVRCLTVGDREALLLHLWRITFGERLSSVVSCQRNGCGEKMDLELKVSDLLLAPYEEPQKWHEVAVKVNEEDRVLRLRVPNGMDQELAAERGRTDLPAAVHLLLQRCVTKVIAGGSDASFTEEYPAELANMIGSRMAEIDPQAEVLLQLRCVACDQPFAAEFDAGAYLYQQLRGRIPYLYREVHRIACSYHWSEDEILSMSSRKRSMYLSLLAGEEAP